MEAEKIRVQLVQINNRYGNQYYLPYSVGALRAFARQYEDIERDFEFTPFTYARGPVGELVDAMGHVDVLGVSCYVWNMRLSVEVAKEVRRRFPDALIVFGGPHVPEQDPGFLDGHPFIDIAVHGEGEETFIDILRASRDGSGFAGIPSTSCRDRTDGTIHFSEKRPRMRDIATLPSPYLDDTFADLVASRSDVSWMCIWETNRGCPFKCTFCDWGELTSSKVLEFDWDRQMAEIDWFARHRIEYLFATDANFGIRKRDIEIARVLARIKQETGFPLQFKVCFTKNSTEKVFSVAKLFHDADMLKGISLSMQSLDETTLKSVKRDNIKLDVFENLLGLYNEAGVSTYTEMIMGLPGETYDSFVRGLDTLLDRGQHSQVVIYNCTVMPNAEISSPGYRDEHGIRTVEIPIFTPHSEPRGEDDPIVEFEPIIVETSTMPNTDWRRVYVFAWAIQVFHTLGLTQAVAIFLRHAHGVPYRAFYQALIDSAEARPGSPIHRELGILDDVLDNIMAGIGLDQYFPEFSTVTWPPEEASLLRLVGDLDALYAEIRSCIRDVVARNGQEIDDGLLDDLVAYQRSLIVNPDDSGVSTLRLSANLADFVTAFRNGGGAELERGVFRYEVDRGSGFGGDMAEFARRVVWFGRKGGKFLYNVRATCAGPRMEARRERAATAR